MLPVGSSCTPEKRMVSTPFCHSTTSPEGETSTSNFTHSPFGAAGTVELLQWVVLSTPLRMMLVPGEQTLPLVRFCPSAGPRICASTDTGKLSPTAMVLGSCEKIITPLLAI